MSDISQATPPLIKSTPLDSNSQATVALRIVYGLVLIGGGAIVAAVIDRDVASVAFGAVGVVVGSLATALNAPSGISSVIAAANKGTSAQ